MRKVRLILREIYSLAIWDPMESYSSLCIHIYGVILLGYKCVPGFHIGGHIWAACVVFYTHILRIIQYKKIQFISSNVIGLKFWEVLGGGGKIFPQLRNGTQLSSWFQYKLYYKYMGDYNYINQKICIKWYYYLGHHKYNPTLWVSIEYHIILQLRGILSILNSWELYPLKLKAERYGNSFKISPSVVLWWQYR